MNINMSKRKIAKYLSAVFILTTIASPSSYVATAKDTPKINDDPFLLLRGKWRGSGTMTLKDKPKVRVSCNAKYTGSASQLILVIKCFSTSGKIDMRAKLSSNANRLRGVWEEKTFRVIGTISGKITENTIDFKIAGNVWGKMKVSYTKSRQKVSITTRGITLKDVQINMKKQ